MNNRISEDIELGVKLGVDATPALYLSGRRVPRMAVRQSLFWQKAKERLDQILQARTAKQADTQQQKKPQSPPQPTPDTPGP